MMMQEMSENGGSGGGGGGTSATSGGGGGNVAGQLVVKARFNFKQNNEDELSFNKGEIIQVTLSNASVSYDCEPNEDSTLFY